MGLDFSTLVYLPNFDLFARPITVDPIASQPGAGAYTARAIYHSDTLNAPMDDGSIFSDQVTSVDILEAEFGTLPEQNDLISIPVDPESGTPALGTFQVVNVWTNGGGETTLQLRRVTTAG